MDIAAVIRDWIVAGVVLYIAVRYGFLRDQERASFKAEIERLKGMAAPAIAAEHKSMKEYAEGMTRNNQELLQRLKELEEVRIEPRNVEIKTKSAYLRGRAAGLIEYSQVITTLMDEAISVVESGTGSWPATNIGLLNKLSITGKEMIDVAENAVDRSVELRTPDEK